MTNKLMPSALLGIGLALGLGGSLLIAATPGEVTIDDTPMTSPDVAPSPEAMPDPLPEMVPLPEATETPSPAPDPAPIDPAPEATLPPCEYEDSDNCFWDASERGNGYGCDFVTIDGVTTYGECTEAPSPAPEAITPTPEETPPAVEYEHDSTPDVANPETDLPDWRAIFESEGFVVGDVIVCPPPLEVAIDRYPDGTTWASCQ